MASRSNPDDRTRELERTLDGILPESVDRRKFIHSSVASVMGGMLAGCTGGSGDGDSASDGGGGSTDSQSTPETGGQSTTQGEQMITRDVIWRQPWKATTNYSVAFLAANQGYFSDNNVSAPDVRAGNGSGDTARRVGTGKEMLGAGSITPVITGLAEGLDVRIYGTQKAKNGLALIYRKDLMDSPDEVGEASVAIQSDGLPRNTWPVYKDQANVPDTVDETFAADKAINALFTEGDVAAMWTPVGTVAELTQLVDADLGVDLLYTHLPAYGYVTYSYTDWLADNQEYVTRVLEAYSRAGKWVLLNPETATDVMRQEVNTNLQATDKAVELDKLRISVAFINMTDGVRNNGFGYLNMDALSNSLDQIGQALGVSGLPPAEEVAATSVVENAELAPFSSDEWSQLEEFTAEYGSMIA